jgi:hypothetical protein
VGCGVGESGDSNGVGITVLRLEGTGVLGRLEVLKVAMASVGRDVGTEFELGRGWVIYQIVIYIIYR